MNTAESTVKRSRRRSKSFSSMTSFTQRGERAAGSSPVPPRAKPSRDRNGEGRERRHRRCRSPPSRQKSRIDPETKSRCRVPTNTARSTKLEGAMLRRFTKHVGDADRPQIRPKSNGPPMRLAATDNDPSLSPSSVVMSNMVSETGAGGERRRQSAGRDEVIGAPQIGDHGIAHGAVETLVLDYLDVGAMPDLSMRKNTVILQKRPR